MMPVNVVLKRVRNAASLDWQHSVPFWKRCGTLAVFTGSVPNPLNLRRKRVRNAAKRVRNAAKRVRNAASKGTQRCQKGTEHYPYPPSSTVCSFESILLTPSPYQVHVIDVCSLTCFLEKTKPVIISFMTIPKNTFPKWWSWNRPSFFTDGFIMIQWSLDYRPCNRTFTNKLHLQNTQATKTNRHTQK